MNENCVQKKDEGNPERATAPHAERASAQEVCRVVGIGASAGGLEAFTRLLEHLPATTGMAYVFVQHLDPPMRASCPACLLA
jgi:two-component system, chemotaxis family, CheB/CheR fusion protein